MDKVSQYISTLFASRTQAHIFHLQTTSYAQHIALGAYYDGIIDATDALVELIQGRYGIVRGMDVGLMRTIDVTEDIEPGEGIDTYWIDTKFQLMNKSNIMNKPIVSLGYGFGYMLLDEVYINTLYMTVGVESKQIVPFYSFRYELISEEINLLPTWVFDDSDGIRKAQIFGLEYNWKSNVKPVFEVGRFYYDSFSDGLNVITVGINYYK